MKNTKILWFKRNPTAEDKETAKAKGLIIRDPAHCHGNDFVEICNGVCGEVPVSYGHCELVSMDDDPKPAKEAKAPVKDPKPAKEAKAE